MILENFTVRHVRIIEHAEITPSHQLNLIIGENATGKTSLLESIDCLSRGRSFRTRHAANLISHGQAKFSVAGEVVDAMGNKVRLGIEKSQKATRLRLGGESVSSVAEFARRLPVQVMHPLGYNLIEGSPRQRRAFIDWGVFHLEYHFTAYWKRFRRALKQRNFALKHFEDYRSSLAWHEELADAAAVIDNSRQHYLKVLSSIVKDYSEYLLNEKNVEITYQRGWPEHKDLLDILNNDLESDKKKGYTRFGPHNADLRIHINKRGASEYTSRSQQKLLTAALKIAQVKLLMQQGQKSCSFLIDDMPSELDVKRRYRFLELLKELGVQVFLTALSHQEFEASKWNHVKMFHVKRGRFSELI